MPKRLMKVLADNKIPGIGRGPFTHIVLLAGTNDLREGSPPAKILGDLRSLHDMIRAAGAECVAVTIPQLGPADEGYVCVTKERSEVNAGLHRMAQEGASGRGPPLALADFDAVLSRMPAHVMNSFFVDFVHFSDKGYDILADVVYATLQGSPLPPSSASMTAAPSPFGSSLTPFGSSSTSLKPQKTTLMQVRRQDPPNFVNRAGSFAVFAQPPGQPQHAFPMHGASVSFPLPSQYA